MKKLSAFLLASILLFSLTACRGNTRNTPPISNTESQYAQQVQDTPTAEAVTETVVPTDEPPEIKYIGNIKSKIFHRTDCWWLPEEWNQIGFSSREEAIGENYSPCGNCNP